MSLLCRAADTVERVSDRGRGEHPRSCTTLIIMLLNEVVRTSQCMRLDAKETAELQMRLSKSVTNGVLAVCTQR